MIKILIRRVETMRKEDAYEISEEYYDRLLIEMRNLDAVEPDTSCEILGKKRSHCSNKSDQYDDG